MPPPPPPPGQPSPQAPQPSGSLPPPAPARKSNKGCIIALVVIGVLGAMGLIGFIIAAVFVGRAVDDATDGEGLPGLLGGVECAQFQFSYMSLTFTGLMTAGADEAQQAQVESQLRELEDIAPSEIADDMSVVADAFRESLSVATGGQGLIGGEETEQSTAEAEAVLQRPEVVEAQENINRWVEENCA